MALEIVTEIPIESITHPHYQLRMLEWYKWRLTYEGGWIFINEYLRKHKSETHEEFSVRKNTSYCPAFSKSAVRDVANSIFQSFPNIVRVGGSPSYQSAILGKEAGVDLTGDSMNTFMGGSVLPELLVMGKVGVYVDMPLRRGATIADNLGVRPYLYVYKAEDIRSWEYDDSPTPNIYKALLLRDTVFLRDKITKLPTGTTHQYRYYYRDEDDGLIYCQFYTENSEPFNPLDPGDTSPIALGIDKIPFVNIELNNSLMSDIADYQIALLNLASASLQFGIGTNYPFYTEQFDPRASGMHLRNDLDNNIPQTNSNGDADDVGGVDQTQSVSFGPNEAIDLGPTSGRRYAKGLDRPDFVNPSIEPMKGSLEYQASLKEDIRLLINLSITNLAPRATSAESRGLDERLLESGLNYIGLMLEDGERQIANIWHLYEKVRDIPTVTYPDRYSMANSKEKWTEVEKLQAQMQGHCSITFKREVAKRIVHIVMGASVSRQTMLEIEKEIDDSEVVDILVDLIVKDVQAGILDPETAGELRGYPVGTAKKAQEFHASRLKLIQMAQTPGQGAGAAAGPGARGVPDQSPAPSADVQAEKEAAGNPVRGAAD